MQGEWPDQLDQGVILPLDTITEHPDNPSVHTDEDIWYLRASLRRYGYIRELVVRRQGRQHQMIAGPGMRQALLEEGGRAHRGDHP